MEVGMFRIGRGRVWTAIRLMVLAGLAFVLAGGLDEPDATGLALAALASLAVCVVILLGARAQRAGATSTQMNLIMIAVATIVCGAVATAGGHIIEDNDDNLEAAVGNGECDAAIMIGGTGSGRNLETTGSHVASFEIN